MTKEQLLEIFEALISYQTKKVLKLARNHYPNLTPEDIRNPQDFPNLLKDPNFNYEDGILSGYISARIAVIEKLKS